MFFSAVRTDMSPHGTGAAPQMRSQCLAWADNARTSAVAEIECLGCLAFAQPVFRLRASV